MLETIADFHGLQEQLNQTTEECGELVAAVNKYRRYNDLDNLIEEMADVQIMINQLVYLFDCKNKFKKIKKKKLIRELKRIGRKKG